MTGPRPYRAAAALVATVALAGCGGASSVSQSSAPLASTPSLPVARPPAPAPETAAAARSAAQRVFARYAAGQFWAVYPMLDTQVRATVSEDKWVAVHQECRPSAARLSYKVGRPVMAGHTAVMVVSLAGVASGPGREKQRLVYEDGSWYWSPSPSDISAATAYKGSVVGIVARLKAAGKCGNSS